VGHFLGLVHQDDPANVMNPSADGTKLNGSQPILTQWYAQPVGELLPTVSQGSVMRGHCAIRPGCSLER
jgi:hypothetical protein